jgi:hypothetical protein
MAASAVTQAPVYEEIVTGEALARGFSFSLDSSKEFAKYPKLHIWVEPVEESQVSTSAEPFRSGEEAQLFIDSLTEEWFQ